MTIRIELTPEEEARLRERAAVLGAAPESLAGDLLRSLLQPSLNGPKEPCSLAEFLGDYIGAVQGTCDPLASSSGEAFREYLQEKRREGRL